ncbi:hypothetical protein ACFQX6_28370 [Streptosporangium lutulentum]
MRTILLQAETPGAGPAVVELSPGREVTFGRGAENAPVDFPLDHPGVSRRAGVIRAVEDYWLLTNLSRDATLAVENPEGGGEFLKVAPGRVAAPIPFEFARVVLPVATGPCSFLVFASQHSFVDFDAPEAAAAASRRSRGFPWTSRRSTSSCWSRSANHACATARPRSSRRCRRCWNGCAEFRAARS